MRLSVCTLVLTLSLAGCGTFTQLAKDTAKEVATTIYEKEKPKIQAAISRAKESAITTAKETLKETKEDLKESIRGTLASRKATLDNKPDAEKTKMEKLENYLLGLLGVGGIAVAKQFTESSRKKERDLKMEMKG